MELDALGVTFPEWWGGWMDRIAKGNAVAFGPHAILGVDREREGVYCTSFQASKSFEDPATGWRVTKEMRRAIPELMRERDIRRVNTYSLCVHPDAERWFRMLGLTEDITYEGRACGPFHLRRFTRS